MTGVPKNFLDRLLQKRQIRVYKDIPITPSTVANACAFITNNGVSRLKTPSSKDSKAEVISETCDIYNEIYKYPSSRFSGYTAVANSVQEPRSEVECKIVDVEEQLLDDDEELDELKKLLKKKLDRDDETEERKRVDQMFMQSKLLTRHGFGTTPSTAQTKIIQPGDNSSKEVIIAPQSEPKLDNDSDIETVDVLPATPPPLRRSKRRATLTQNCNFSDAQSYSLSSPPRKQRPRLPSKPIIMPPLPQNLHELYKSLNFENHSAKQRNEKFGPLKITGGDIHTLRRNVFTNDTIIDEYLKLICKRSQENESFALCCYFHTSLRANGSQTVRSWIKEKLTDYELIFVPLNTEEHWYLFVIDMINRTTFIYDSIYGNRDFECEELRQFFKSFIGDSVNWDDWATIPTTNQQGPTQTNSTDCGIFLCQYAECLSRNVEPDFVQPMMPNFRIRMRYELLTGQLLPPPPRQPTSVTDLN